MVDPENVRSLTEFQRNARKHINRLKKTGKPEILTVNGCPALIVQDPASYQRLAALADEAAHIAALEEAVREMRAGKGRPIADVARDVRNKLRAMNRRRSA